MPTRCQEKLTRTYKAAYLRKSRESRQTQSQSSIPERCPVMPNRHLSTYFVPGQSSSREAAESKLERNPCLHAVHTLVERDEQQRIKGGTEKKKGGYRVKPGGWRSLPAKVTVQPGSEGGGGEGAALQVELPAQTEEPAQGLGRDTVYSSNTTEAMARDPAATM